MLRNSGIYIIILMLMLQTGCEKGPLCGCFTGTGDEITEERPAAPFHYVELKNKVDLHVHYSTEYRITVTAGKKLAEKVTTEIKNGRLTIHNENKCNWVRDFKNKFDVHIYTPLLDTLEIYDSPGNVYFADTMRAERFAMESWSSTGDYNVLVDAGTTYIALQTGPASLTVSGKSGVSYLWNQGQGIYDATNLRNDDIYATNRGSNHMYLRASNRFYGRIEFTGNVYYGGIASDITLEDYGDGEFLPLQ